MVPRVTFGIGRLRRAPEPLALSFVSEIPLTCSFDGTDDWAGITPLDDVASGLEGPWMDSAEDMFVAEITQKFANLQYNITAGVCQKFGSKKGQKHNLEQNLKHNQMQKFKSAWKVD